MAYYLVQGDTGPQIKVTVTRDETGDLVDMTGATVYLKLRKKPSNTLLLTLTATDVGTNLTNGIAIFVFSDGDLDIEPGNYEGEIEINFTDGSKETIYETLDFFVREDF